MTDNGNVKAGDAAVMELLRQRLQRVVQQHNDLIQTERELEAQLQEVGRQRQQAAGRAQELHEVLAEMELRTAPAAPVEPAPVQVDGNQ